MSALFALLGCATTGTYRVTYTTSVEETRAYDQEVWHNRYMWGIIEEGPVRVQDVCEGGRFTKIHSEKSFKAYAAEAAVDAVGDAVGVDTSGIWDPSNVYIWCADGLVYRGSYQGPDALVLTHRGTPLE